MNPKEAILKIKALFEDMPEPMPEKEEEVKVEMAEYVLEDGTKVMISSLEVGGEVVLEDGTPAPDAEHKLADGQVIVTEGGKITEIKVAEEPVEIEIEAGKKMNEKMEDVEAKISALEKENEELKAKIAEFEKKAAQGFSQVIELIEVIAKVPQADPIEKTQSFKFESTKDIKFDRLNKYRNAILNNKN
jgi:N-methylhydantoinase B/oxoprolinase/acetone carboxylase alpha subunit